MDLQARGAVGLLGIFAFDLVKKMEEMKFLPNIISEESQNSQGFYFMVVCFCLLIGLHIMFIMPNKKWLHLSIVM